MVESGLAKSMYLAAAESVEVAGCQTLACALAIMVLRTKILNITNRQ